MTCYVTPLDALRDEAGFRRSYDGHVQLLTREGEPVEVRGASAVSRTQAIENSSKVVEQQVEPLHARLAHACSCSPGRGNPWR
jgi:hypothetical protein